MHACFNGYVNSKTTLKQFVQNNMGNALRDKVKNQNRADFNDFNSNIPYATHYAMEQQFLMLIQWKNLKNFSKS